ncbi:hypothetical protein PHYSODRAFT_342787 [Phytophthora sojae]|uniref:pyruvate kinase n=1 Tax=Phytophthora sojae (strain P6497) TaxID=1094619 RepID=G5AHL9_PHYSP|nr:hypothetical protein PHYSODRAFT_342787 [Phytophthora sojae]EGZ04940.1 hypothetical protein PHYSODRAFT_342787 [Phytophthora sojae]|eukprot:XP_009539570.1 hypothetical protein PHYSODRAFT_342787 [Phytophthora sojae]
MKSFRNRRRRRQDIKPGQPLKSRSSPAMAALLCQVLPRPLSDDSKYCVDASLSPVLPQMKHETDPVKVGDMVLLPDGLIRLTCTAVGQGEITCQIKKTEEIGSPRGVNLLGLVVELPALLEKDTRDLDWGVEHDIDFVAASFIRKASEVQEIRPFIRRRVHWPLEPKFVAPKNSSRWRAWRACRTSRRSSRPRNVPFLLTNMIIDRSRSGR